MVHNYHLKYKNIELRQVSSKDLEFLRTWRNNRELCFFLSPIPYITSEMQQAWYKSYLKNDFEIMFAIIETCCLNRIVGSASIYNIYNNEAEFGKFLIGDFSAHGKKIGANSLFAILNFAFSTLKLKKVYLKVYEDNIPAVKVYESVGFYVIGERVIDGKKELAMAIDNMHFGG